MTTNDCTQGNWPLVRGSFETIFGNRLYTNGFTAVWKEILAIENLKRHQSIEPSTEDNSLRNIAGRPSRPGDF